MDNISCTTSSSVLRNTLPASRGDHRGRTLPPNNRIANTILGKETSGYIKPSRYPRPLLLPPPPRDAPMNTIRSIAALNQRELEAGTSDTASWHADYADTAYIYIGGLPYELSEGDVISIFSQYGEPVHCNLIRDKETGKSRGFAFLKYEDQRSTNLAVDNLSGANILGRIISVDHHRYKHKEDEEKAEAEAREKEATQETGAGGSGASRGRDEDSRRPRKRDAEEEEVEPRREPTQKERELMKLMRDVDDDDPMKEYMIQQKKDEIEAEKALVGSKKKRRERGDRDKDRHRHRHRHRPRSRSPRRHRSRSQSEGGRTNEPTGDSYRQRRRSEEREEVRNRSRDHRYHSRR